MNELIEMEKAIKQGCTCGLDGGKRDINWKTCPIHAQLRRNTNGENSKMCNM